MRGVFIVVITGLLAACAVGPDYVPPRTEVSEEWLSSPEGTATGSEPANPAWWDALGDPTLSALVARAVESNRDLAVAAAIVSGVKNAFDQE